MNSRWFKNVCYVISICFEPANQTPNDRSLSCRKHTAYRNNAWAYAHAHICGMRAYTPHSVWNESTDSTLASCIRYFELHSRLDTPLLCMIVGRETRMKIKTTSTFPTNNNRNKFRRKSVWKKFRLVFIQSSYISNSTIVCWTLYFICVCVFIFVLKLYSTKNTNPNTNKRVWTLNWEFVVQMSSELKNIAKR